MAAWRRPPDWASVILGVILLILTLAFAGADTWHPSAFWTGMVIGLLLVPISLYLLSSPEELGVVLLGMLLSYPLATVRPIRQGGPPAAPAGIVSLPLFVAREPAFRAGAARLVQLILAILLFIAPWVLRFDALVSMVWTCRIIGAVVFVGGGLATLAEYLAMPRSGED